MTKSDNISHFKTTLTQLFSFCPGENCFESPEAYGFLNRVIIRNTWFSIVRFVVDELDFFLCDVVLLKPLAPLFPVRYVQLFS